MIKNVLGFAIASLVATTANAATTTYTSRAAFLSALGSSQTTQFSTPADGFNDVGALYTGAGFTIAGQNMYEVDAGYVPIFYNWNSGAILTAQMSILTFTTDASVRALGFDFGNPQVYDPGGRVTVNGVDRTDYAQPTFAFYGVISDAEISPITVNFNGSIGIIDNVTTNGLAVAGVPEPASWALLIGGFGFAGAAMRRRRTAVRVTYA